jgi:hypothetical protein
MVNLSDLPKTLFSPFKTLFIGYVILIALGKIIIGNFWEFFGVSLILMIFEIGHNDFLRIVLNNQAGMHMGKLFSSIEESLKELVKLLKDKK